jgi:hypothetical protein
MTYLHCPRCRLAIRRRADFLTLDHCPRCLARTATAVPLFTSPLNAIELRERATPLNAIALRDRDAPTVTGVQP